MPARLQQCSAAPPSPSRSRRWASTADDAYPKMDAQGGAHRALRKSEPALRALRSELGRGRGPPPSALVRIYGTWRPQPVYITARPTSQLLPSCSRHPAPLSRSLSPSL